MLDNLFTPTHLWLVLPFFLGWSAVYVLPTIVAVYRQHHNRVPITLVNILLGWTAIGWVVALIWAFTPPAPVSQPG